MKYFARYMIEPQLTQTSSAGIGVQLLKWIIASKLGK